MLQKCRNVRLLLPLTSDLELLQVAVVLGAVEEEASLPLRALDEAVGGEQFLHHAGLPQAHSCAVSKAIAVQQAWVETHLHGNNGKGEFKTQAGEMLRLVRHVGPL